MGGWIKDDQVRSRIPAGYELPARFDDFLRAKPPFAVEWNDLDAYCLKRTATKEAVPFLRLPDGSLVVFWYHAASPAIVLIGSEGELNVIATDFDEFLRGIAAKCSGLPDFDESDADFRVPGVKGEPNRVGLPALQQKFDKWFKKHTSLLEPLQTADAEWLRHRVYKIAEDMIRDGRSKVYTPSSPWWLMEYRIERSGTDLSINYLDFGEWYPVANKYGLIDEVIAMLNLVKNKTRSHYELSVCSAGIVSIDRDRELVLVPPNAASEA